MRLLLQVLSSLVLMITSAAGSWAAQNDVVVNVEAMIGEATLVRETPEGKRESLVVPTGKTTQNDPTTGQTLLAPATVPNRVNAVVQAIAASSPDADNQQPSEDGCSQGNAPHRLVSNPEYDAATAAAIDKELAELSSGELMMVMAVLINNAKHLCIDTAAITYAVELISKERPEEAGNVVYVASLLDPDNANRYAEAALKSAPTQARNIEKAKEDAIERKAPPQPPPTKPKPPIERERDIPPGGSEGTPPSPE